MQKQAKRIGFFKRVSKFSPTEFFNTLLYCASRSETCSLSQASTRVQDKLSLSISKQGIDNRFNAAAVEFTKSIFKDCLENEFHKVIVPDFFTAFNRVLVKDATRFVVPDRLKDPFKGTGSQAGVSIQYEYDIKNGRTTDLTITDAKRCDLVDAKETISKILPGDLIIRDLGYFILSLFSEVKRAKAFFLSRLNAKCHVFKEHGQTAISFKDLYEQMNQKEIALLELNVTVGIQERLPVRLIVQLVPEEVYKQRIRKIEKQNKKTGYKISDDYRTRCRFNLFITNVEEKHLPKEAVYKAYKIRWQIELMFKHWKSTCKIHNLQPMKYERYVCLLYAKLILIIINLQLIRNLQGYYFQTQNKLLSEDKCFKTLTKGFERMLQILKQERSKSISELTKIIELFSKEHWKEKRIKRVNYIEIIALFTCISDK